MHECASKALTEHLKTSLAIDKHAVGAVLKGEEYIATVLAARREKEAHCMAYVACYRPNESAKGLLFESCLKDDI